MSRRRNGSGSTGLKWQLAERIRTIRREQFGESGLGEFAREVGVPTRTWYSYESGVTVPAEVILRFVELTWVHPTWLLSGQGPRYQPPYPRRASHESGPCGFEDSGGSGNVGTGVDAEEPQRGLSASPADSALPPATSPEDRLPGAAPDPGPRSEPTSERSPAPDPRSPELRRGPYDGPYIRNVGDAMAPIIADGAFVAYADADESPLALEKKLVVAHLPDGPIVRWFHRLGSYAVLRAENPAFTPSTRLIDVEGGTDACRFHRVLWIGTAH
jgi:hypothetical protein